MKWKKACCVEYKFSGPAQPKHLYLQQKQEIVCEFRRVSKLPLNDVYSALKKKIPNLMSFNLHQCLKRNGLNALAKEESALEKKFIPLDLFILTVQKVRTDQKNATFLWPLIGPQSTFMSRCIQRCRLTSPVHFEKSDRPLFF
ncbi:hypothetical protein P618_200889 [Holospora obtusa F1]|uniref:Uncharacterized protein n=1 Tax=Holospora obtusa F1 TaxID=1399147 RepID=W6TT31_HOLOB|nr:hypothetical protein [Holospora obtusa]ETZ06917.1 hypothetical protein P618_200889 [Holospora obtusa F1]